ncbi:MAG: aminotransferase class I/II-fold pyridoxal phosphate-dependent enzyme [Lachnospiraceae bacterium]|nr:aminotransferase class I/II-fold pyridoxal phosphate-dependent enzyme [Lachnospiraceae bacterium]
MKDIYSMDITEIDDFDDLHAPTGIIADMQQKAASLYGADRAWISVNGSSAAIEAALISVCCAGEKLIMPRASHKSVYFAAEVGRMDPVYISQEVAGDHRVLLPPDPERIAQACDENPDAKCVLVTSPTYEGLIADIRSISDAVHSRGKVLVVDGAHGAHLGFAFGEKIIEAGADLAIVSLHKMLPSPTQTALLLSAPSMRSCYGRISHHMQVFQSSSPSYVLMAGIDECLNYMESRLQEDNLKAKALAEKFRADLSDIHGLDVSAYPSSDPLKVVIRSVIDAKELYRRLREDHHIQCEMYGPGYVLAMFSPADDERSFDRLRDALFSISDELKVRGEDQDGDENLPMMDSYADIPRRAMSASEALEKESFAAPRTEITEGSISASYICLYPPGIPIVIPGEIIDKKVADRVNAYADAGMNVTGLSGDRIMIVKEHE